MLAILCTLASGRVVLHAQPGSVEVTLLPSALEIPASGSSVPLVAIVRNPTGERLRDVKLQFLFDAPVKIDPGSAMAPSLGSHGDLAWTFRVSAAKPLAAGNVLIRVDYTTDENVPVSHVRTATLPVSTRASYATDDVVALKAESSLQTLQQHRPGRVYLVVTNKSDTTIEISRLEATGPDFIALTPSSTRLSLGPRQTSIVSYDVEAKDRVVPGKHLLVFRGAVVWPGAGEGRSVVATREVDVGVFGESVVLQALAVPSFLLLPGFLALITARLLWEARFLRPGGETAEFKFKFPNPDFWLLSITISGLTAYLYPLFGQPSYLEAYGPADVARVWILSVFGIGAGGYVLLALVRYGYGRLWNLSSDDSPARVLAKLALRRCELPLNLWTASVDSASVELFPLGRIEKHPEVWALPFIDLTFAREIAADRRERVTSALNARDANRLWRTLWSAARRGEIALKWSAQGPFQCPIRLKRESLGAFRRRDRIVRLVEDVASEVEAGAAL